MTDPKRNRLKVLLIALIFFAPPVIAGLIYFAMPEWMPDRRVNYGTLIEPVRAVPTLALLDAAGAPTPTVLRGKWSLVLLGGADCDAECEARLLLTRQVRLALNQNRGRVQRLYIAPGAAALQAAREQLAPAHPDLVLVADAGAPGQRARDFFAPATPLALYLVDPVGNWLMVYAGDIEPKGLHKDLKKLLRFSQIG